MSIEFPCLPARPIKKEGISFRIIFSAIYAAFFLNPVKPSKFFWQRWLFTVSGMCLFIFENWGICFILVFHLIPSQQQQDRAPAAWISLPRPVNSLGW